METLTKKTENSQTLNLGVLDIFGFEVFIFNDRFLRKMFLNNSALIMLMKNYSKYLFS